jgi:hypothetical protein
VSEPFFKIFGDEQGFIIKAWENNELVNIYVKAAWESSSSIGVNPNEIFAYQLLKNTQFGPECWFALECPTKITIGE